MHLEPFHNEINKQLKRNSTAVNTSQMFLPSYSRLNSPTKRRAFGKSLGLGKVWAQIIEGLENKLLHELGFGHFLINPLMVNILPRDGAISLGSDSQSGLEALVEPCQFTVHETVFDRPVLVGCIDPLF